MSESYSPSPEEYRVAEENIDSKDMPGNNVGKIGGVLGRIFTRTAESSGGKTRLRELTEARGSALVEGGQRKETEFEERKLAEAQKAVNWPHEIMLQLRYSRNTDYGDNKDGNFPDKVAEQIDTLVREAIVESGYEATEIDSSTASIIYQAIHGHDLHFKELYDEQCDKIKSAIVASLMSEKAKKHDLRG